MPTANFILVGQYGRPKNVQLKQSKALFISSPPKLGGVLVFSDLDKEGGHKKIAKR